MPSKTHEFRVRRVERYMLTEHVDDGRNRGSSPVALFDKAEIANDVAEALAAAYEGKATLWREKETT